MPKLIYPASREEWLQLRTADITSTESAALFGLSPYTTAFELYHQKKSGEVVTIDETARMTWGKRLEDAIARGVAEDQGWQIRKLNAYARRTDMNGMGASFDFEIINHPDGPGILEIKNVDYLAYQRGWLDDADGKEAPAHIELQLQHQLEVMDREWGAIVAMVAGNTPQVIIRKRDRQVGLGLLTAIAKFWVDVVEGRAPQPDYPRDAAAVAALHQYAEPGKILNAKGDALIASLLHDYQQASKAEKAASEDKATAKARLLELIGDAEKVTTDVGTVSAGMVGPAEVAYTRAGYRNFRFTPAKVKAEAVAA